MCPIAAARSRLSSFEDAVKRLKSGTDGTLHLLTQTCQNRMANEMKADVYRCLHSHVRGTWSLRSRETKDYGRVRSHRNTVIMEDVEYVVQKSGKERACKENQRNVHAFCRGQVVYSTSMPLLLYQQEIDEDIWVKVRYEYDDIGFFTNWEKTHQIITSDVAVLEHSGACYAIRPRLRPLPTAQTENIYQ